MGQKTFLASASGSTLCILCNLTKTCFYKQEVGGTRIYLAEVQTIVETLNLKYGAITRSDPLRFVYSTLALHALGITSRSCIRMQVQNVLKEYQH